MDGPSNESTVETVTVEILGTHLRVRVPSDRTADVLRAADVVRERIDEVREASDPPDRAVTRAALELAFEAIVAQRDAAASLEDLIARLDDAIQA